MHGADQRGFDRQRSRAKKVFSKAENKKPSDASKDDDGWLSAKEAISLLAIKRETLYAYASRGMVESRPGERGRPRRYLKSDVERLCARRDARAGHGAVAAGALRFGEPVLDSSITEISGLGPRYRGYLTRDLAVASTPFENVAELLWTGVLPSKHTEWPRISLGFDEARIAAMLSPRATALDAMALALAVRRASLGSHGPLADPDELAEARFLVPLLAASAGLNAFTSRVARALAEKRVAGVIAVALDVAPRPSVLQGIDRALVLVADHELNVSAFGARVAASAATDLLGCVGAALAVLSGPRHGALTFRIESLLDDAKTERDLREMVATRLSVGEAIPGFGHRLYPDGDPRCTVLLEAARKGHAPHAFAPRLRMLFALVDEVARHRQPLPTVDIGLVATRLRLGLPRGAAALLFAVGRSAGWIAHVLEQRTQGALLRPRARYVGPLSEK